MADLIEKLDALYVTDLNDVDVVVDNLAWGAPQGWYQIILDLDVSYDLRGMAARVFTQSLYPRCPDISDPRKQTAFPVPEDSKHMLEHLVKGADTRLIFLGILEGLDRVSDFKTAQELFRSCSDVRVAKRLNEMMDECAANNVFMVP